MAHCADDLALAAMWMPNEFCKAIAINLIASLNTIGEYL
jgi:hypothetical protein